MGTRNFHFKKSPTLGERGGRFVYDGADVVTSGVPVLVSGGDDGLGRALVELAAADSPRPKPGEGGILVFENIQSEGFDERISTFSDYDLVEAGDAVQVVTGNGGRVKVSLTTTPPSTGRFGRPNYPKARVMVTGALGASATVAVGDFLTPGAGNATTGYWKETSNEDNAWLYVTEVNPDSGVVIAEVLI